MEQSSILSELSSGSPEFFTFSCCAWSWNWLNCKEKERRWPVHCVCQTLSSLSQQKSLMVVGIDVYHDAARGGRSVGGFVASMNKNLTRWYSRVCFQSPGQELIDGLKMALTASLKQFHKVMPLVVVVGWKQKRTGLKDGKKAEPRNLAVSLPFLTSPRDTLITFSQKISRRCCCCCCVFTFNT